MTMMLPSGVPRYVYRNIQDTTDGFCILCTLDFAVVVRPKIFANCFYFTVTLMFIDFVVLHITFYTCTIIHVSS